MKSPPRIVIYRGPSLIDGAPILAVATARSSNRKTGDVVSTWILRADIDPVRAIRSGKDAAICGACPHRGTVDPDTGRHGHRRSCYVLPFQAPLSIYRAVKRHRQRVATADTIAAVGSGRIVRLGSYGDPAAVPVEVWRTLLSRSLGHVGYTHQWRSPAAAPLRRLCMASVDTDAEREEAQRAGWRTFRVLPVGAPLPTRNVATSEVRCIATISDTTCETCRLCDGQSLRPRPSVAILAHGTPGFNVPQETR